MKIATTVGPTLQAVTLAEAREQCSLFEDTSQDALLLRLIDAVTRAIENQTGSRIMEQTLELQFDGFTAGQMDLGVYPIQAITELAYDDENESEQTLAENTDYWASLTGIYPTITPVASWPATQVKKPGRVRITVTAGHASRDDVSADLKHAILVQVAELFEHREETITGMAVTPTLNTVAHLINPHRRLIL